jgi:hypothetical protein
MGTLKSDLTFPVLHIHTIKHYSIFLNCRLYIVPTWKFRLQARASPGNHTLWFMSSKGPLFHMLVTIPASEEWCCHARVFDVSLKGRFHRKCFRACWTDVLILIRSLMRKTYSGNRMLIQNSNVSLRNDQWPAMTMTTKRRVWQKLQEKDEWNNFTRFLY